MRRFLLLALAALACGREAPSPETGAVPGSREPDPVVLRVPRSGGIVRAAVYPALDSVIWEASGFPAISNVLAFDPEAGLFAVVNRAGRPVHLDLRLGRANVVSRDSLRSITSANGSDIFGIDRQGRVMRLSPAGVWSFTPPRPAQAVYAQPDRAVLVAAAQGAGTTLWRLYPPDDQILDSVALPPVGAGVSTQTGDRLYFATDTALLAIQARTLTPVRTVRLREPVAAAAVTPSADRLYLALRGTSRLRVISRFTDAGPAEVELPGEASDLRMDPLGRYLLARPAGADSVWVIAIATGRVVTRFASRWLPDLPAVAPDGAIATAGPRDVVFLDVPSGRETLRAAGGASEFWIFFYWNGFRPRAEGLDIPVTFPVPDTATPDTAALLLDPLDQPRAPGAPRVQPVQPPVASAGFTVSFATLLSQQRASALADSIVIGTVRARVVPGEAAGVPIYRVVVGPYPTRDDAEAAGRASRRQYWIFEGQP